MQDVPDYSAARPDVVVQIDTTTGPRWPKAITIFGKSWQVRSRWDRQAPFADGHELIPYRRGLDHLYRLYADGHKIYVTEPYDIDGEAITTFAELIAQGWDVRILPRAAIWYPDHTTAVWCQRLHRGIRWP